LHDYTKVIYDPKKYVMLDDSILDEIRCSEDPRLEKARALIERMDLRQHYKCVGEKGLSKEVALKYWGSINENAVLKYQDKDSVDLLNKDDICVKKIKINHGLKNDHPLNHVMFFNTKDSNASAKRLNKRKLESMLPK